MNEVTYVPLSNDLLVQLVERYKLDYTSVIERIVDDFLERTEDDFNNSLLNLGEGYLWENLFLPENTKLRTKYFGEFKTATLRKNKFWFEGKAYNSPSIVCKVMRGNTSNNAWRMFDIQRPTDLQYRSAEKLRK